VKPARIVHRDVKPDNMPSVELNLTISDERAEAEIERWLRSLLATRTHSGTPSK
jgi:hypothetical protein